MDSNSLNPKVNLRNHTLKKYVAISKDAGYNISKKTNCFHLSQCRTTNIVFCFNYVSQCTTRHIAI